MARVRKAEREGKDHEAERFFAEGIREVGIASAEEFLSRGQ